MRSRMVASVVDFPDPVGPVTSTSPRGLLARSATTLGRPSSSKPMILNGIARKAPATFPRWMKTLARKRARKAPATFPRWMKTLARKRESFWTLNERSSSLSSSKRCFCASVSTE
jgi:hypothetical protein